MGIIFIHFPRIHCPLALFSTSLANATAVILLLHSTLPAHPPSPPAPPLPLLLLLLLPPLSLVNLDDDADADPLSIRDGGTALQHNIKYRFEWL